MLLGVFMVAIASAWARGLQIHCGCFGGGGPATGVDARDYLVELVRDAGLLGGGGPAGLAAAQPVGPRPPARLGGPMSTHHTRNHPTTSPTRPEPAGQHQAAASRPRPAAPAGPPPAREPVPPLQRWAPIVLLVVAVVAGIAFRRPAPTARPPARVPAHALGPGGGELLGRSSAPVLVEEYGDFQCPVCGQWERTVGPTARRLVDQGRIRFEYHPIAFIGPESLAAANAAEAAGDEGAGPSTTCCSPTRRPRTPAP